MSDVTGMDIFLDAMGDTVASLQDFPQTEVRAESFLAYLEARLNAAIERLEPREEIEIAALSTFAQFAELAREYHRQRHRP